MAYLIVHLAGSIQYILIEYAAGSTLACDSDHSHTPQSHSYSSGRLWLSLSDPLGRRRSSRQLLYPSARDTDVGAAFILLLSWLHSWHVQPTPCGPQHHPLKSGLWRPWSSLVWATGATGHRPRDTLAAAGVQQQQMDGLVSLASAWRAWFGTSAVTQELFCFRRMSTVYWITAVWRDAASTARFGGGSGSPLTAQLFEVIATMVASRETFRN